MPTFLRLIGKGLLALAPVIILLWILTFAYGILARIIGVIFNTTANNTTATFAIIVILLLILAYAGYLLEKNKDFILLKLSEFVIDKIPGVASVYHVIKDMVKMFSGSGGAEYLGVGYLRLGEHQVVGFITKECGCLSPLHQILLLDFCFAWSVRKSSAQILAWQMA